MKSKIQRLLIGCMALCCLSACDNFEDINTNPNATQKVTPGMLATDLILGIMKPGPNKYFVFHNMASKQLAWGEGAEGYQYNDFGRSEDFTYYYSLVNIQKMNDLTTDVNREAYTGLGLFIKAYKLFYLSMEVGDIPYSEASMGETGMMTPKYDSQKDVMVQVLKDLAEADTYFSKAKNFEGDPVLKGNVAAWRKVVNSFRLKVLMNLSKKEGDTDLNIKATFASIAANSPLLESNADNLQLVYSNKGNQIYPFNKVNTNHYPYGIVSSVLIDNLKALNDYRLFYYAEPSTYAVETDGKAASDWDAYPGIDPSMPHDDLKVLYNAGKFCGFNNRYTNYEPGEPLMRIGFAEQNFIMAEAVIRGWINGNAEAYYKAGIRAAMEFIAAATPETYSHTRTITPAYIDEYLAGPKVVFATTADSQLKQVWIQKYILYFMQHIWDSFYDYRRTGYPVLPINPNTNRNEVKDKIPVRWMYPQKEYNVNMTNLSEALDRQYSGQDKINDLMWILK